MAGKPRQVMYSAARGKLPARVEVGSAVRSAAGINLVVGATNSGKSTTVRDALVRRLAGTITAD